MTGISGVILGQKTGLGAMGGRVLLSAPSPLCGRKGAPSASRSTGAGLARGALTLTVQKKKNKVEDNHTRCYDTVQLTFPLETSL